MSICGVKCIWSLNGFQHCVFFFPIHLDTVDGSHRDVGSVGSPCCFLVPAEEVLDLQRHSMEVKNAYTFKNASCLFSYFYVSIDTIVYLVTVISAIE